MFAATRSTAPAPKSRPVQAWKEMAAAQKAAGTKASANAAARPSGQTAQATANSSGEGQARGRGLAAATAAFAARCDGHVPGAAVGPSDANEAAPGSGDGARNCGRALADISRVANSAAGSCQVAGGQDEHGSADIPAKSSTPSKLGFFKKVWHGCSAGWLHSWMHYLTTWNVRSWDMHRTHVGCCVFAQMRRLVSQANGCASPAVPRR